MYSFLLSTYLDLNSQLKTCKSWKEIRKEFVDSEFKIGGWHVMNRVQHDDIWNSEFTNISIKKFATLDPTTQNTNRFLSRMITFLAILSTLKDRKEEKKSFAPWHAYHWIIEPHYIHALQGHSGCWAGAAAAVHTHTRSYNKTATDFSYIYLSLAHSFSSASASLVEMMLREGGQEELSRGRDLTRLKMATIATMFAKDKLMKQLPLNVV